MKPGIAVMANTQYLFSSNSLATDRQYEPEDAVLSETTGLGIDDLVNKLLLGKALAANRPLWNYLGTFQTGDINRLQTPEVMSMNVSATVAFWPAPGSSITDSWKTGRSIDYHWSGWPPF